MEPAIPTICPSCQTPLPQNSNFCFNCGKKIKEPPVSTSVLKQIGLYALSFFLPPLGLWPGIKYLRQQDQKAKTVGLICVALTIISTILTIWVTIGLINSTQKLMQSELGGAEINYQIPGFN